MKGPVSLRARRWAHEVLIIMKNGLLSNVSVGKFFGASAKNAIVPAI